MSLSCSCEYDDPDWWYEPDEDFSLLATKRGRKCCSCKVRIPVGADALAFRRWRSPEYGSIEERIYGDEVPMSPWFMCEKCGGLYMAVSDLKFCCNIEEDIATQIREYMAENAVSGTVYK